MREGEREDEIGRDGERGLWLGRLEAELARELGQPITLTAGGEAPAGSAGAALALPGARLILAADLEEMTGILEAGRLIAAGHGDAETVRDLWMGILASVAARLGGRLETAETVDAQAGTEGEPEPCTLRLGDHAARLTLSVATMEGTGASAGAVGHARGAAPGEDLRGNYDLLLEVELDAQVRFGSREVELKELLELGPGDVVELDRNVADPVDLIVGGRIVARGEVVLVDGNFGLRVTEVAEPVRRLESIRCMA
jgi:flagellar motor switch protein FliN/FliY